MWKVQRFDETTRRWRSITCGFAIRDVADRALVAYAQRISATADLRVHRTA